LVNGHNIKSAGSVRKTQAVIYQVSLSYLSDERLLMKIHCLKAIAVQGIFSRLYFYKDQIFSVFCNYIDFIFVESEVLCQDFISLILQISGGLFF